MKRLLLAMMPLLVGAVKAPPAWRQDPQAALQITAKTEQELKARGVAAAATAQVLVSPDEDVLYVTLVARKAVADREALARELVDDFLAAPRRAQLTSTKVRTTALSSRVVDAAKEIEALVHWQDEEAGYTTHSRMLIVADAEHLIAITGECLLRAGASVPTARLEACDAALATLDPELAADKRVAITLAPEGTEPAAAGSATSGGTATISDGSRTPLPPMIIPGAEPARTVDRRPVYVGAGLVVLAGLFWWNRRRRERLEARSASSKKDTDE